MIGAPKEKSRQRRGGNRNRGADLASWRLHCRQTDGRNVPTPTYGDEIRFFDVCFEATTKNGVISIFFVR
jgi:hypothetical protein